VYSSCQFTKRYSASWRVFFKLLQNLLILAKPYRTALMNPAVGIPLRLCDQLEVLTVFCTAGNTQKVINRSTNYFFQSPEEGRE
jgi:hypothetical protein